MNRFAPAIIAAAAATASSSALAGVNNAVFVVRSAPTLGEVGLGLLVVLVAAVGGYLTRRKK